MEAPNLRRKFWAAFLNSSVEKDGQVPGFAAWWDNADEWQQQQAMRYAYWAAIKIERDHRDPDECIASGVVALRELFRLYIPPAQVPPASREEVARLVGTLGKGLGWSDKVALAAKYPDDPQMQPPDETSS